RLRGEWHLVKTNQGKNTWLLFKSKDAWAGTARDSALGIDLDGASPADWRAWRDVTPMTASRDAAAFVDSDWLFEAELPGQRALLCGDGAQGKVTGLAAVPAALANDVQRLPCERALLDGVLVAVLADGRPDPAGLPRALAGDGRDVVFYAHDLLGWE